jgi:hypothetical protein
VSPIFIRPVREQLEHDRLIRHLQAKYKRKFDVAVNLGEEQAAPVKLGAATFFPDLVLTDGKKLAGLVEVETGESVNNLEAMAQWVHFARARVPFHLYVPVPMYDAARRLCDANHVKASEVWTYRPTNDGFDLVRMSADAGSPGRAQAVAKTSISTTKPAAPATPVRPTIPAAEPASTRTPPVKPAKPKAVIRARAKPSKPAAKKRPAPKPKPKKIPSRAKASGRKKR